MLQIKDTEKLFEHKDYFKHHTKAFSVIMDVFAIYSLKSVTTGIFSWKQKGYPPVILLQMLVLLPFIGAKNIYDLLSKPYQMFYQGKRDSLYDLLKNEHNNWRLLLFNFSKRFIKRVSNEYGHLHSTYFIADDTDLEKRTPFFEAISRVFNHVTKAHPFAYKMLALGFSDGKSFVPVDFSFHNEKGKKKNYGLTKVQRKNQYSKKRDKNSYGAKRKKELRMSKGKSLIKMMRRAVKHGITANYLLTDSWFLSEDMIHNVRKIKGGIIHIISMCKMDKRKYKVGNKMLKAGELLSIKKLDKKNIKRSRKHKLKYIEVMADYKGHKVKLFFVRLTKRSKWRLLVTTDTALSFTSAYEHYSNRWAIEVFFKESKQLLGLGKNQSHDFDAQIASATVSLIQYIILATHKRVNAYETIGGIFESIKDCMTEQVFTERLFALIKELIEIVEEIFDISIDLDKTIEKIIENSNFTSELSPVFSTFNNKGGNKCAA